MRIILAKSAGFCFGVKRATRMAFDATEEHDHLSSLGPIIHSPQLVRQLEEKGVRVVDEVPAAGEGAVIIRSHGVTRGEMEQIARRQLEVVDATCPFVKKAQEFAAELSADGYHLVLVGEEEHPEVQGIVSYGEEGRVSVVADPEAAERLPRSSKIGVIAQTTQSFDNFNAIVGVCLRKAKEVRVYNTICDATSVRQQEAKSLAARVDLMLVVGGRNSANTTRLAVICRELQDNTRHIETADDLEPGWLEGVETVGLTAGASTPSWLIEQVVARLETLAGT
ncbi:4-hydroxy-3-methylbut-2-enyl diphosphate reductase [Geothermobacter hydrogeniphilus]|uniref:4-hydroxy-3-methylbut-2-enyl diphosphate reductase n=1 Tax=Geothermobacter hydrogeniphilus TaxID=1969733 RepID=A0A2K2HC19_9BACT|nr:4-hydroxy-3-methylbut-2-enyl diphosphate reductase [Geothermobacter hydrogeniphilus]PNU20769.1 4-hydroxy-3-methylbut-2-enyl diphosphate reductase [Geothermobacter hydrogeniphilus]